jgi:RecA/RadA recombinase
VIDSCASIAAWYRCERFAALGIIVVDSMTAADAPAEVEVDEADPRLEAVRVRLRDRLKGLLGWTRETGRA